MGDRTLLAPVRRSRRNNIELDHVPGQELLARAEIANARGRISHSALRKKALIAEGPHELPHPARGLPLRIAYGMIAATDKARKAMRHREVSMKRALSGVLVSVLALAAT